MHRRGGSHIGPPCGCATTHGTRWRSHTWSQLAQNIICTCVASRLGKTQSTLARTHRSGDRSGTCRATVKAEWQGPESRLRRRRGSRQSTRAVGAEATAPKGADAPLGVDPEDGPPGGLPSLCLEKSCRSRGRAQGRIEARGGSDQDVLAPTHLLGGRVGGALLHVGVLQQLLSQARALLVPAPRRRYIPIPPCCTASGPRRCRRKLQGGKATEGRLPEDLEAQAKAGVLVGAAPPLVAQGKDFLLLAAPCDQPAQHGLKEEMVLQVARPNVVPLVGSCSAFQAPKGRGCSSIPVAPLTAQQRRHHLPHSEL